MTYIYRTNAFVISIMYILKYYKIYDLIICYVLCIKDIIIIILICLFINNIAFVGLNVVNKYYLFQCILCALLVC